MEWLRSDLDCDIDAGWEVELLELIDGFSRGLDDIDQALMRALLESFLGFLVRVRGALDGKALDAGWQRDGPGDARPGAFDRVGNVAGGLVYDPVVISLQANANALSSHTKNNCLLMVKLNAAARTGKREAEYSKGWSARNRFLVKFVRRDERCVKTGGTCQKITSYLLYLAEGI